MQPKISVTDLKKAYGTGSKRVDVFGEINFAVEEGEFLVILGPSGCGKTTLLKMLDGLIEPTSGTIEICGTRVKGPREGVAMVFQSFELLPWRTVADNIALGLEIQGIPREERYSRVNEWCDRVGLTAVSDRYPYELSGGMKQRVGLARALAVDPGVLLLDEPFGSLDAQTKDEMQTELLRLWNERRSTAVFITHDIEEAVYLGDRILVMSEKPASFVSEIRIDFDRPRWKRRVEIEADDRFEEIKARLRADLGLTFEGMLPNYPK